MSFITGKLQPQDAVVQKPLKGGIKAAYNAFQIQRFQRARNAGGGGFYATLCNFKISIIKPYTPMWLSAGWKRVADDTDMVRRGWAKCGLREVFDPTTQANAIKSAKLASSDKNHILYPLFPQSDRTAVPQEVSEGIMEPDLEPVRNDEDPNDFAIDTAILVMDTLTSDVVPEQPARAPVAGFLPMFNMGGAKRKVPKSVEGGPQSKRSKT